MCSLNRWVGIETHKDVMYCTTCNVGLFVLWYHLFHSDVNILNTENPFFTRFKKLKRQKITKFYTLVWFKFVRNAYTTIWSLLVKYSHKLFLSLNKNNLLLTNSSEKIYLLNKCVIVLYWFVKLLFGGEWYLQLTPIHCKGTTHQVLDIW